MKTVELRKDDLIPYKTGANVAFYLITWGASVEPFSMKVGGNINYLQLGADGSTLMHTHEYPEIFLVLSGKLRHNINGENHELPGGTLVFVRPTDFHCFEPVKDETCELVNFSFQIELLLDFSEYMQNDFFLKRFTAPVTSPTFKLSISDAEKIAFDLMRINSEQMNSASVARIRIKSVIAELFTRYFLEPDISAISSNLPEWVENLCGEMKKPENFIAGLKKMQTLSNCTPEHLCKTFRKYLDKTPTEFINELRANYAANLLADTDEKIYSIATDLGFQSLSRFYKIFKRYFDMSPAQYRNIKRKSDIPI